MLTAALLGGGGGAFAVASFGPDASALPVRQVAEFVTPLALGPQTDSLVAGEPLTLFRTEASRATDTAETLLTRLGIVDPAAAAYLRNDFTFRQQVLGRAGRQVSVEATGNQNLAKLTVRWTPGEEGVFKRLIVSLPAAGGGFISRVETAPLVASTRIGGGEIRTSLFAAVDAARVPDDVARQIADIFSAEIDFERGLRRGDRFNVVYESLEADGEPMKSGRVLSVEFTSGGKTHQAMWFAQPGQSKGAYFNLDGKSLQSAYLASPLEFSRVTSGFAMRMHPILQRWKAHLGVDYAAPTGTPVRTVGDGVVEFAGWQNGFGNVVMVQHNANDTTVYAHLSRIDVRVGQKLEQNTRVGAVGATGWATGPHLHFEFRVNDVQQDPIAMAQRAQGQQLSAAARPVFDRSAQVMRQQLAAASTSQVATAQ